MLFALPYFYLDYNPWFIKGCHIACNENELTVPKGVDGFDLNKAPTLEYLQTYTEVIRSILVPPAVLIIRFTGIGQAGDFDLYMLTEIIGRLQKSGIAVIFPDVKENVKLRFREFGVEIIKVVKIYVIM